MSEPQKQLDPDLQEKLVAYLDGELDAPARRRVEEMLANDPRVRSSMQKLDRTWELLDELDAAPPDDDFTHTTLEMVAAAAAEDARRIQSEAPRRRRRRWLLLAAGMLAVGAAGYFAVAAAMPDPNRQLLQDLPLLENFNQYRQIDSLDFLRRLTAAKIFVEEGEASDEPAESLAERRERIQNMSAAQKDQLLRRQQQFQALDAEQQRRIRLLHEQLHREPDGEKLRETLAQYSQWLAGLPGIRRITLEELDPSQRIARIRQEHASTTARIANGDDRQALLDWMKHYAKEHETRFLKTLPEERRQQLAKMKPEARQRMVLYLMCQRWQYFSPAALGLVGTRDLADLRNGLSPQTRGQWAEKSPAEQWAIVAAWIRQAAQQQLAGRKGPGWTLPNFDEQLVQFFERLGPEEQDRLLSLPGDELQQRLREKYLLQMHPGRLRGEKAKNKPAKKPEKDSPAAAKPTPTPPSTAPAGPSPKSPR